MHAVGLLESMDCGDVGMIESSQHLCFALKSRQSLRIVYKRWRHDFDCHITSESCVIGLVNFSHCTGAQLGKNLVRAHLTTDQRLACMFTEHFCHRLQGWGFQESV